MEDIILPPLPPPPPRRRVIPPSQTTTTIQGHSLWNKTKEVGLNSWNGLYKLSDQVGYWSNHKVAQLGVESFYPTNLELESNKAARILRNFTDIESEESNTTRPSQESTLDSHKSNQPILKTIPKEVIENCQGLAIFTVFRTGLGISAAGGSGIVLARLQDGTWSGPSGILLHTIGVGFMAGADIYDVVLILRTQKAVESFSHPRVTLGGEISITAGPIGNGFSLESGIELSPIWSYIKSKGIWGGISLVGNFLIERNDENERCYGMEIKAREILKGEKGRIPHWCEGIHQTILAAEGKPYKASSIPSYSSSSSTTSSAPRRLPPEELDSEDLLARQEMEAAMIEFGIEDPKINHQLRSDDALLLQGSDLDIFSSPLLVNGSSRNSSSSIEERGSPEFFHSPTMEGGGGEGGEGSSSKASSIYPPTPPALPPRKQLPRPVSLPTTPILNDDTPNSPLLWTSHPNNNGLLIESNESPPPEAEERRNSIVVVGVEGGVKPIVPPRRSRANLAGGGKNSISGMSEIGSPLISEIGLMEEGGEGKEKEKEKEVVVVEEVEKKEEIKVAEEGGDTKEEKVVVEV